MRTDGDDGSLFPRPHHSARASRSLLVNENARQPLGWRAPPERSPPRRALSRLCPMSSFERPFRRTLDNFSGLSRWGDQIRDLDADPNCRPAKPSLASRDLLGAIHRGLHLRIGPIDGTPLCLKRPTGKTAPRPTLEGMSALAGQAVRYQLGPIRTQYRPRGSHRSTGRVNIRSS